MFCYILDVQVGVGLGTFGSGHLVWQLICNMGACLMPYQSLWSPSTLDKKVTPHSDSLKLNVDFGHTVCSKVAVQGFVVLSGVDIL